MFQQGHTHKNRKTVFIFIFTNSKGTVSFNKVTPMHKKLKDFIIFVMFTKLSYPVHFNKNTPLCKQLKTPHFVY